MIKEAIVKIVSKEDLTYDEAYAVMNEIMSGETSPTQNAAFLAALSTKSTKAETTDEIAGCAAAMRDHATKVDTGMDIFEIVGTGGDNAHSFNISTTSALVAAAGGMKVAKHGNRAASSQCGTADCLEALGVNIQQSPEQCVTLLKEVGMCFFFAQKYHSSMKYVGAIRKELGAGDRTVILSFGGSLGARTINESVLQHLDMVRESGVQFIWQTGKYYSDASAQRLKGEEPMPMLHVTDFISDMGAAYKAADLVISRAGASSISEFCLIGKPVILVPSPNVAEDHQTKNAMALVNKDAAIYVKDADAPEVLLKKAVDTVKDEAKLASLCENIKKLGLKNSADVIADEVIKLATK